MNTKLPLPDSTLGLPYNVKAKDISRVELHSDLHGKLFMFTLKVVDINGCVHVVYPFPVARVMTRSIKEMCFDYADQFGLPLSEVCNFDIKKLGELKSISEFKGACPF